MDFLKDLFGSFINRKSKQDDNSLNNVLSNQPQHPVDNRVAENPPSRGSDSKLSNEFVNKNFPEYYKQHQDMIRVEPDDHMSDWPGLDMFGSMFSLEKHFENMFQRMVSDMHRMMSSFGGFDSMMMPHDDDNDPGMFRGGINMFKNNQNFNIFYEDGPQEGESLRNYYLKQTPLEEIDVSRFGPPGQDLEVAPNEVEHLLNRPNTQVAPRVRSQRQQFQFQINNGTMKVTTVVVDENGQVTKTVKEVKLD